MTLHKGTYTCVMGVFPAFRTEVFVGGEGSCVSPGQQSFSCDGWSLNFVLCLPFCLAYVRLVCIHLLLYPALSFYFEYCYTRLTAGVVSDIRRCHLKGGMETHPGELHQSNARIIRIGQSCARIIRMSQSNYSRSAVSYYLLRAHTKITPPEYSHQRIRFITAADF